MEDLYTEHSLAETFCRHYLDTLAVCLPKAHRTYGFEYEFLPAGMLGIQDIVRIDRVLEKLGGQQSGGARVFENGVLVTFEPGGQIEYCSPPLRADESEKFEELLSFIDLVNDRIQSSLGIEYLGVGFLPGRANFPLCLRSPRYLQMHRRFARAGTRGHEMMKGTASIHLHISIGNLDELVPLFYFLCELSGSNDFGMSPERRDIWSRTDPTRSGPPPCCSESLSGPDQLIGRLIRYALEVVVLGEEVPFEKSTDRSFSAFLYHMTTIFTDVRFNLKGPTLELRTLDSMPIDNFRSKWRQFIDRAKTIR